MGCSGDASHSSICKARFGELWRARELISGCRYYGRGACVPVAPWLVVWIVFLQERDSQPNIKCLESCRLKHTCGEWLRAGACAAGLGSFDGELGMAVAIELLYAFSEHDSISQ